MADGIQLHYSRGRNVKDNRPVQRMAVDMADFIKQLAGDRAKQKAGAAYICGPLNGDGRRCAEGALPRGWVAVDLDRIEAGVLADVMRWFERFSALCWHTHSSTPAAPRLRVLIELRSMASRDQCIAIGTTLERELSDAFGDSVVLDVCTFRPEQPVHVPPVDAMLQRFSGAPMDVPSMVASTLISVRPTEEAQKNSEVALFSSVPLLFSSVGGTTWHIPPDTIPAEVGQRNACLFRLARYIKANFPNGTNAEIRAIALKWHESARSVIGTTDFSVTLADLLRGIERVKQPFGSVMQEVLSNIDDDAALPVGVAALSYGPASNRLVRICAALQARAGDGPFFLSTRQAGELVGVHFTDAGKMFSTLVADGVLELVTRGSGKLASRFRYVLAQGRLTELTTDIASQT